MAKATIKLGYDVPPEVYQMLVEDAKNAGLSATKLIIKLIEENNKKG